MIGENVKPTQHDLILSADEDGMPWRQVETFVKQFTEAVENYNVEESRILLMEAVSGFYPQCEVADLVFEQTGRFGRDKAGGKIRKIG